MILNRESFHLKEQCVIEKLLIKPPHRFSTVFQDNACFLHCKQSDTVVLSATGKLHLAPDNAVVLKCGSYFADFTGNLAGDPCEVFAVHLYPSILKELYGEDFPVILKPAEAKGTTREIGSSILVTHFIESLGLYFEHREQMNTELLLLKIKEIVLILLQTNAASTLSSLFLDLYSPRQASISEVIESNIHSDLSLEELAALSSMSLSTFKRAFQKQYQDTPANYLKEKRLVETQKLLLKTDLSVSEICYRVGFKDIAHFSRSFKEKYTVSPTHFRSLNR